MKLVTIVLATCLLVACASSPYQEELQDLRVMSFNIRYDNPSDGADAWPNRRTRVASLILFYSPEILGLQEVLLHQRDQLSEDLGSYAFLGGGRDDGVEAGEFAPIAYQTDRLEPLEQGHFWLSATPDKPSVGWDAALPRIATWARFEDRTSGGRILALNTHFDHRGKEARLQSARLIGDWIDQQSTACETVVLLGDFNAPPSEAAYQEIVLGGAQRLVDARAVSETPLFGPPGTSTCFNVRRADDAPIDHVFVGEGVRVIRHGTLTQQTAGHPPSDHYPVLVDLTPRLCPAG